MDENEAPVAQVPEEMRVTNASGTEKSEVGAERDRRGVLLPQRAKVGGIITPQ